MEDLHGMKKLTCNQPQLVSTPDPRSVRVFCTFKVTHDRSDAQGGQNSSESDKILLQGALECFSLGVDPKVGRSRGACEIPARLCSGSVLLVPYHNTPFGRVSPFKHSPFGQTRKLKVILIMHGQSRSNLEHLPPLVPSSYNTHSKFTLQVLREHVSVWAY